MYQLTKIVCCNCLSNQIAYLHQSVFLTDTDKGIDRYSHKWLVLKFIWPQKPKMRSSYDTSSVNDMTYLHQSLSLNGADKGNKSHSAVDITLSCVAWYQSFTWVHVLVQSSSTSISVSAGQPGCITSNLEVKYLVSF